MTEPESRPSESSTFPEGRLRVAPIAASTDVRIIDIRMPFGSMVVFMIKWALAAIPAVIILFFIVALFGGLFAGLFSGISHSGH
jgi:hypothetical protein